MALPNSGTGKRLPRGRGFRRDVAALRFGRHDRLADVLEWLGVEAHEPERVSAPGARVFVLGCVANDKRPSVEEARGFLAAVFRVVGGQPFYLQLVGEALVAEPPPHDEESLKPVLQSLLFSRTGRLGLYFENVYQRLVGKAATAAATLAAIAELGPARLTDVARRIGAQTGSTARYIERLGDSVVRDGDRYVIADPVFALWLRWRSPGGTTVPMTVLGDEAEKAVAAELAGLGFELVYQSRASRGAFDLLALRGGDRLGVQVKRRPLPLRFKKREWKRMGAEAARYGWQWVIAAVDPEHRVAFLDPAAARESREFRVGDDAAIDNLLAWVDR